MDKPFDSVPSPVCTEAGATACTLAFKVGAGACAALLSAALGAATFDGSGVVDRLLAVVSGQGLLCLYVGSTYFRGARGRDKTSTAELRTILGRLRDRCLKIGGNVARTAQSVDRSTEISQRLGRLAESVLTASSQSASALEDTSYSVQVIAASCEASVHQNRDCVDRLRHARERVGMVNTRAVEFAETAATLKSCSLQVQGAVQTVGEIARQTNLLALNLAIEAARAGATGRAFGVVAAEVRQLSSRVQGTADQIISTVDATLALVDKTAAASVQVKSDIELMRTDVELVTRGCESTLADMQSISANASRLAATTEQLSAANVSILESARNAHALSKDVSARLDSTSIESQQLFDVTEAIQEELSRLHLDGGALERKIGACRVWTARIDRQLSMLASDGVDLFDVDYRAIAGTHPQQHLVTYQPAFARAIQPLLDQARDDLGAQACACIALDCYTPTHNTEFSCPPTGDPAIDVVRCRDKRIMNEGKQGLRSAQHEGSMLLQTYVRDNGQLACEMAFGLRVGGRRWGALRVAFDPEQIA